MSDRRTTCSRRSFVGGLTLAGAANLLHMPGPAAAEPSPETTKLRLIQRPVICFAPQYVADSLLQSEGFTDVAYLKRKTAGENYKALASGEADIGLGFGPPLIARMDAGDPIVFVAGGHVGCLQLFANEHVRAIHDLKGKTVSAAEGSNLFLASMLSYVGLDPHKDVRWAILPESEATQRFIDGKVDAVMLSPPFPQELIAKKIGRLVLNTSLDRP